MDFEVHDLDYWYKKSFPEGENPKVIGFFSQDSNGYKPDLSQLKYYSPPQDKNVNFNLNEGYERVIHKDPIPSNIDNVLRWANSHPEPIQSFRPHFISMRGVISSLWSTFVDPNGWIICAQKFRETIYLCAFPTAEKRNYEMSKSEKQKRMCAWGPKFEQFVLSDDPKNSPNTSKPVNAKEEFCGIFSYQFGEHNMLYAGEVDGVISNEILKEKSLLTNVFKFCELKTSSLFAHPPTIYYYLKLAKCWSQSFLSCVEKIVFGYRTGKGILKKLEEYTLDEVNKTIQQRRLITWNPEAQKNFCHAFLKHVKEVVTEDYDKVLYKFCWNPDNPGFKRIETETLSNVNSASPYSFLPDMVVANMTSENEKNLQDRIVARISEPEPHSSRSSWDRERFRDNPSRTRQLSGNESKIQTTSTRYSPYSRSESEFLRKRGNPQRYRNYNPRSGQRSRRERRRNRY